MDKKKIAFIICVNNLLYFEECKWYIERLDIPDGYEIDVLAVQDAESMCAAYNLGMKSTDAKYKIYMHQDVFIREQDFLSKIIAIFEQDKTVGMIGMMGGNGMPKTGVTYLAWNVGLVDCRDADMAYYLSGDPSIKEDCYVEAIDGLLMATQYDVPWREDLFTDFDFYDVSASFEMRRNGYQVLVPYMEEPWVIHDSSFAKLSKYDKNRKICLKEYPEFLYAEDGFDFVYHEEWERLSAELVSHLKALLDIGDWNTVCDIIEQYRKGKMKDSTLEMIGIMSDIWKQEQEEQIHPGFFDGLDSFEGMYEKYIKVRFLLRRMELISLENVKTQVLENLKETQISCSAILVFIMHGMNNKSRLLNEMQRLYQEEGDADSVAKLESVIRILKNKEPQKVLTKRVAKKRNLHGNKAIY